MDCIGIYAQQTVDQLGEEPRGFGGLEHLDRCVLGYERTARVHRRAKAGGGRLDLGTEVGGRAPSAALPPLHEPGGSSRRGPVGDRVEMGIVRPDQVGLEPLDAAREKRAALTLGDRYDAGTLVVRGLGRGGDPSDQSAKAPDSPASFVRASRCKLDIPPNSGGHRTRQVVAVEGQHLLGRQVAESRKDRAGKE